MSTRANRGSRIYPRYVKSGSGVTQKTPPERERSLRASEAEVVASSRSPSQAVGVYESPAFRLAWDNDIAFHVAENAILLRKFREKSQAEIAVEMGTSQSAVARIESGDDNITLGKLNRLVEALKGRIRFTIEPEEIAVPRWPHWTTLIESGLGAVSEWDLKAAEMRLVGTGERIVVGAWTNHDTDEATVALEELAESAEAS